MDPPWSFHSDSSALLIAGMVMLRGLVEAGGGMEVSCLLPLLACLIMARSGEERPLVPELRLVLLLCS